MIKYDIDLGKYTKISNEKNIQIPKWLTKKHFDQVKTLMGEGNQLQAVKYLMDCSAQFNTRTDFGLKWGKCEVVDVINTYRTTPKEEVVSPISRAVTEMATTIAPKISSLKNERVVIQIPPDKNEIIRVLYPFLKIAYQCLHNSSLNKDQVVYAYNSAQITMQDLRNVEALLKRLLA